MKYLFLLFLFFHCTNTTQAQKQKADSMAGLLLQETTDTGKVINMWKTASYLYTYAPDSTIRLAQKALFLAERIKYKEGESRSLGQMANGFLSLGNYPQALEFYLKKLKIEESGNKPYNLASVLMNIGIVYVYREEYDMALFYLHRSDSIISQNEFTDLQFNINLNIGDVFNRMEKHDSAFFYFSKSLHFAAQLQDGDFMGTSMTGLGHVYRKVNRYDKSMELYMKAMPFLQTANNEDVICEAALGLAKLYQLRSLQDSSVSFARYSYLLAEKDGFQSRQMEAAGFLTGIFNGLGQKDSAFFYLQKEKALGDSLNSKEKIRASESLTINEQFRQEEMAETARRLKDERRQQLQLLLIGLCIPVLFLVTLMLSRVKVHARIIRFLGVISLLILFEYLTLLLHPKVVEFTHHTPFYELLIFVAIASLLIPAHHRIEHWLIKKLTLKKNESLQIKKQRMQIKKTS